MSEETGKTEAVVQFYTIFLPMKGEEEGQKRNHLRTCHSTIINISVTPLDNEEEGLGLPYR